MLRTGPPMPHMGPRAFYVRAHRCHAWSHVHVTYGHTDATHVPTCMLRTDTPMPRMVTSTHHTSYETAVPHASHMCVRECHVSAHHVSRSSLGRTWKGFRCDDWRGWRWSWSMQIPQQRQRTRVSCFVQTGSSAQTKRPPSDVPCCLKNLGHVPCCPKNLGHVASNHAMGTRTCCINRESAIRQCWNASIRKQVAA
jgi:hypothetical protein